MIRRFLILPLSIRAVSVTLLVTASLLASDNILNIDSFFSPVKLEEKTTIPSKTAAIREHYFTGAEAGDHFGASATGAGDVNGDGYEDIIVGAPDNDKGGPNTGMACIYFGGRTMSTIADIILTGKSDGDRFGCSVASAGDFDGDGYDDVIIGASNNDAGGANAGMAYLYFGSQKMEQKYYLTLSSTVVKEEFGSSVSGAGDINGDGYDDVVIGAPCTDYNPSGENKGRAYIFFGGKSMDKTADLILSGENSGDHFGCSVAVARDINGDGYSDVIIGADWYPETSPTNGKVYIYYGGIEMDSTADLTISEGPMDARFGRSVSGADDINGDGYSDIIVGGRYSYGGFPDIGQAMIYFGGTEMDNTADIRLFGQMNEGFGCSVSGAGDINGDGYSDVIVGANFDSRAYIFFGGSSMDEFYDVIFNGELEEDNFGGTVAFAGDVNSDGIDDVIIGASMNDLNGQDAGRAYLYVNSLTGLDIADESFNSDIAAESFGYSLSGAGDINGDGYDDFIVGSPCQEYENCMENKGSAYIYWGGECIDNTADLILIGENSGDDYGGPVAVVDDLNGDGYSDIVVSAPAYPFASPPDGRVYVYFGGLEMDSTADLIIDAENMEAAHGRSIAGAGDVNGDGYNDIIVGAVFDYEDWIRYGQAFIYFGGTNMDNKSDIILSHETDIGFGCSVTGLGDVNGDGYSDVIVGNYNNKRAYLYFGGSDMDTDPDLNFDGYSTSGGADINGDSYTDVMTSKNDGYAYIYFGGADMDTVADVIINGSSIRNAGDVNGDGYNDVIVSPNIYFGGPDMDAISDITLSNEVLSAACAGDVNGDGLSDIIARTSSNTVHLFISSCPPIFPRIGSVKDVPHDQGGKVTVQWIRSGYDAVGIGKITDYVIQRSLSPGVSGLTWENIAAVTATQDPLYSYTASTLYDSCANTDGSIFFRIIARTLNPLELWKSKPVTGYSVDNLAPLPVRSLMARAIGESSVELTWNRNRTDSDVKHYALYRSNKDGFIPNLDLQISLTRDTSFVDTKPFAGETNYYTVITYDIHDNGSEPCTQASVYITSKITDKDKNIPTEFALYQNYPNPFNPITTIEFDLPQTVNVTLRIYNTRSQIVKELINKEMTNGKHRIKWKPENLPSDIYFTVLKAGNFIAKKKLILLK